MRLSEAITELEDTIIILKPDCDTTVIDALNLAICCLKFRLAMKEKWRCSSYDHIPGEDDE